MAGVNKCAKDQETRPVPGALDLRSPDGSVKRGYVRILLNLLVAEDGTLTRMGGFRRLGWDAPKFCNQDLHDPLLGIENSNCGPPCVPPYDVYITGPTVLTTPSIVLHIVFSGHYNDVQYEMFRNGASMGPPGPNPNFTVTEPGNYVGKVVNNCGTQSSPNYVVTKPLIPPPTVTDPAHLTVDQFAQAIFTSTVSGATNIMWQFRADSVSPWLDATNYGYGAETGTFEANTHIVYPTAEVRVKAWSEAGNVFSQPARFVVRPAAPRISGNFGPLVNRPETYTLGGITADWVNGTTSVTWRIKGKVMAFADVKFQGGALNALYYNDYNFKQANGMVINRPDDTWWLTTGYLGPGPIYFTDWHNISGPTPLTHLEVIGETHSAQGVDSVFHLQSLPWDPAMNQWVHVSILRGEALPMEVAGRSVTLSFPQTGIYILCATATVSYVVRTTSSAVQTDFVLDETCERIVVVGGGSITADKDQLCYDKQVSSGYVDLTSTFLQDNAFNVLGWEEINGASVDSKTPVLEVTKPPGVWRRYRIDLTDEGKRKIAAGEPLTAGAGWKFRYAAGQPEAIEVPVLILNCDQSPGLVEVRWLRSTNPNVTLTDINNPDTNIVRRRFSEKIDGICNFAEDPTGNSWCFICLPDDAVISTPRSGDGMVFSNSGAPLVLASALNGAGQEAYIHAINGWFYELVGESLTGWRVFRLVNKTAGAITVGLAT